VNDEPRTPDPTAQGDTHEAATDHPVPTAQKWKPIVVCEISVEGTGLYWLSGGFPKRLTQQTPQRLVPVRVVAAVA
jgi:hypothetical protein